MIKEDGVVIDGVMVVRRSWSSYHFFPSFKTVLNPIFLIPLMVPSGFIMMYFFCLVCKKEQAALGYRGQEASLEHMRFGQCILPQPPAREPGE